MREVVSSIGRSYNTAITFLLLAGSLHLIYFFVTQSRLWYIGLAVLIYVLSRFVRSYVFKLRTGSSGFTELGLFFVSFLFIGYFVYALSNDTAIHEYLPNALVLQSGVVFFFIFIASVLSGLGKRLNKAIVLAFMVAVLYGIQRNENGINALFSTNAHVLDLVIGLPLVYLGCVLFGAYELVARLYRSLQ